MAYSNVSGCVASIVGSFSTGLDVFKKLRENKRNRKNGRWHRTKDVPGEEEQRLSRALRQGPEDIGLEYQKSVYAAGDQFAIGDAVAQTSLAEILLRLNTGLVNIISSFLDRDRNPTDFHPDFHALADLADRSRIDTCRTLRRLFRRMMDARLPPALSPGSRPSNGGSNTGKQSSVNGARTKRKAPTANAKIKGPTIARVVIQNSSKPSQIALVKPSERRKKASAASTPNLSIPPKSPSEPSSPMLSPPPAYTLEAPAAVRPHAPRSTTAPAVPRPRRKQSAANVKPAAADARAEALRATRSTPRLATTTPEAISNPSVPNLASPLPLDASTSVSPAPLPRRRQQRPPTFYSIASDSTRLGEIPLHRWAEPWDFDRMSMLNREAVENGWPVTREQVEAQRRRKKGFGLLRMFRRSS